MFAFPHIDTVTYEAEKWTHPPLSGHVDDQGFIWGRGALDMKSMGVMELMSMLLLKRNKVSLDRDIILLAVADEEDGGTGMQYLVEDHWDDLDCGTLINEGGLGLEDAIFSGQNMYPISVGEKGNVWLRMIAEGNSGHGSTPRPMRQVKSCCALWRTFNPFRKKRISTHFGTVSCQLGAHKGGDVDGDASPWFA